MHNRDVNGIRMTFSIDIRPARYEAAVSFAHDWTTNGSQERSIAPACEMHADNNSVRVYASGYYFCRMGLVKIFEWWYQSGKTWRYGQR